MKIISLYLMFVSFNSGEHQSEAFQEEKEVLDAIEQLVVGEYFDECEDEAEFERLYRTEIQQKQREMKEAQTAGKPDFHFEVEDTWTTVTFPRTDDGV